MTASLDIERDEINRLRNENNRLKKELKALKPENAVAIDTVLSDVCDGSSSIVDAETSDEISTNKFKNIAYDSLTNEEFKRYGRQLIVPQFSGAGFHTKKYNPIESQLKLKNAKILVVGAGGLGCPALLYLTAAGVGTIGIIDADTVDASNLHRQVLHSTSKVGLYKVDSAKQYLQDLNPTVTIITYPIALSNSNAFLIVSLYDLVLDCTDTPMTRYLINDTCVILGKTIVSGSGLKTEGQLSILNFNNCGPCYRCFYPKPPSPNSVKSCSDGGVIGPCIGLVGTMMAVEAIKVLIDWYTEENFKPFLTIYDGFNDDEGSQSMRTFKMRRKQPKCVVCGDNATITRERVENFEVDYVVFCGSHIDKYNVVTKEEQISVEEYNAKYHNVLLSSPNLNSRAVLIDCRPVEHFKVVSLPGFINIPLEQIQYADQISDLAGLPQGLSKENDELFLICRYGNDSRIATRVLKDKFGFQNVKDIKGGLSRWSSNVDQSLPTY